MSLHPIDRRDAHIAELQSTSDTYGKNISRIASLLISTRTELTIHRWLLAAVVAMQLAMFVGFLIR